MYEPLSYIGYEDRVKVKSVVIKGQALFLVNVKSFTLTVWSQITVATVSSYWYDIPLKDLS